MSEGALSDRQRQLAAAAAAAARQHRSAVDRTPDRPVEVGEVFVLQSTSDFPVEWALLERRDAEGPFLAVPGDSHPFLGSRDVEVETSTGVLNLRCQAGLWLEPAAFKPDLRVGTLEPDDLERARLKVREVGQRGFAPDPFLEDVDLSPEYEEWMRDVIHPALAAAGSASVEKTFAPAVALARGPRRKPLVSWWMAAAAILTLMCSGLLVWELRQQQQIESLTARTASSEAALQAEKAQREEAQRTAAEALKEREETGKLLARISALEGRLEAPAQPLLNPPVAILQPTEVLRGTSARSYEVPASAPGLTVVLRFRESEAYPAYRLILTREGTAKPIWQTDGLRRSAEGVQLAMPQRYIPPGKYQLSLSGLRAGKAQPVAEYELMVTP